MNKQVTLQAMLIGYARVSTLEQNLDLQNDALGKAGCEKVFSDTISGTKAKRPGLDECIAYARPGDTIVVWKLDRLGRNLQHLIETVQALEERGVGFKSLQENIDTTTPGGKLVFHVFGALAEFERDLIRERTMAGMAAARARGRIGGRPPALNAKKRAVALALYRDKGVSISEICRTLGVSRTTFYRSLDLKKEGPVIPSEIPEQPIAEPAHLEQVAMDPVVSVSSAVTEPTSGLGQGSAVTTAPSALAVDTPQLEAARRLLALGQTEQERHSFPFQQARHELSDIIPPLITSAELVEWARGEVERADKPK